MKKLLLAVAAIFLSSSAFAQHFEYGVKGGLNQAYFTDDSNNSSGTRAGIHIGVVGEYVFNRDVGLQAELLYSMQGGKYTDFYTGMRCTDKLDYLTLPVLAKIYFSRSRMWSVDLGPQFGYMVSGKQNGGSIYDSPGTNKFDASFCVGISYKLACGLDFTIRGVAGFTDVSKFSDARNNVSQISIGYRF